MKINSFLVGVVLFAFAVLSFTIVYGGNSFEEHGLTLTTSGSVGAGESSGVRIFAIENITIYNVSLVSGVTGNRIVIVNETGGVGGTQNKVQNQSLIVNGAAQINVSLTGGRYYMIVVNSSSGGSWTHQCYGSAYSGAPVQGVALSWVNGSFNNVSQDYTYFCNIKGIYYTDSRYGLNTTSANTTTAETAGEGFSSNITSSTSVSSVALIYNKTSYSGSVTSFGGNVYGLLANINVPIAGTVAMPWYWNITFSNGTVAPSSISSQSISAINFSLCQSAPQNIVYLNFTFKNETTAQEQLNASVPSSSWAYYDASGSGTVNKTFTYSTSTENKYYAWCYTPSSRSVKPVFSFSYDNAESEQRTYTSNTLTLTNTTTSTVLYLLPSSQGLFVTFQVVNLAEQAVAGATVTASRSGIGNVETRTTDSSGSATMFLNPNFQYTVTVSKSGYDSVTTTIFPTQSSYTLTLGGSASTNNTNPQSGVSYSVYPLAGTLNNGTYYNFNLTVNSTFWTLSSWGFTIRNASGSVLASNSSTTSNGGFLSVNMTTGSNKSLYMNYFWVINGTYNNGTIPWGVVDLSGSGWSIYQFFTDLRTYAGLGIFGLDNFGLAVLVFLAIFIFVGIMSYKFGINSPAALMALVFGLVIFFDIGLGLIPTPISAVPHFATILMAILFIAVFLREVGR